MHRCIKSFGGARLRLSPSRSGIFRKGKGLTREFTARYENETVHKKLAREEKLLANETLKRSSSGGEGSLALSWVMVSAKRSNPCLAAWENGGAIGPERRRK